MSSSKRKSKDPDFLGAQIAIQRAASEALQLATLTKTACYVIQDAKLLDLSSGHFAPEGIVEAGTAALVK